MNAISNPRFKTRLAMVIAAICCVMATSTVRALAQDDDDDTFEQKMMRKLLGRDKPIIDYRERSPLVIPPSAELPSPDSGAVAAQGSVAWPQDADLKAKGKTTRRIRGADESDRAASSRMSPDEIKRGKVAGSGEQKRAVTLSDNESARVLRPGELGGKEYSLFQMFSKSAGGEKPEQFAGEPTRELLTEPPTGYRTPSPQQPYLPPKDEPIFKLPNLWDRGLGDAK